MICGYEWLDDERKERKPESHMERPHENTPPHYTDERRDRYIKIISSERTKRP